MTTTTDRAILRNGCRVYRQGCVVVMATSLGMDLLNKRLPNVKAARALFTKIVGR